MVGGVKDADDDSYLSKGVVGLLGELVLYYRCAGVIVVILPDIAGSFWQE